MMLELIMNRIIGWNTLEPQAEQNKVVHAVHGPCIVVAKRIGIGWLVANQSGNGATPSRLMCWHTWSLPQGSKPFFETGWNRKVWMVEREAWKNSSFAGGKKENQPVMGSIITTWSFRYCHLELPEGNRASPRCWTAMTELWDCLSRFKWI